MSIFIAKMNFYPRHPIAESFQLPRHNRFHMSRQSRAAIDVVIGMDLNLHFHFPSLDGLDGVLVVDEHKLDGRFLVSDCV
jgi:hypothetical protein